jgi:hypothetical protein
MHGIATVVATESKNVRKSNRNTVTGVIRFYAPKVLIPALLCAWSWCAYRAR